MYWLHFVTKQADSSGVGKLVRIYNSKINGFVLSQSQEVEQPQNEGMNIWHGRNIWPLEF